VRSCSATEAQLHDMYASFPTLTAVAFLLPVPIRLLDLMF
jgi:hypothetical protein